MILDFSEVIAPLLDDPSQVPGQKPTFGRLKLFDPKSLEHPMFQKLKGAPKARLLKKRKWRSRYRGDQGQTSQCTIYTVNHVFEMEPSAHPRSYGVNKGRPTPLCPPHDLYCEAQAIDPWPGACDSYDGTSLTAALQAAKVRGMFKEYSWEYSNIDVIVETLLRVGPVMIGVDWYAGMMLPSSTRAQYYNSEHRLLNVGPIVGGHATTIQGIDLTRKNAELEIFNSWGVDWGKKGNAFMSLTTLDTLLRMPGGECGVATEY